MMEPFVFSGLERLRVRSAEVLRDESQLDVYIFSGKCLLKTSWIQEEPL